MRRSARLLALPAAPGSVNAPPQVSVGPRFNARGRKPLRADMLVVQEVETSVFQEAIPVGLPQLEKRTPKKRRTKDEDGEEFAEQKQKRRRKTKPEPIYIIPEVEKKTTTFSGRLGYACLNTILRNKKPANDSIFCSRTCRIDSVKKNGMEWLMDLGRKNVEDLITVIQWNEENNIRFFRLSSEMFPFASHEKYGYSLEYCSDLLAKAGGLAKKYGHRLTTHPGQYTQLGSPRPAVVEGSIRELAYHAQMFDLMGLGPDSVMIVHGGGMYEDKITTLERLKKSIAALPNKIRDRLVLENDEMCYNAEDLLPICEELDVPLVFDYHHDMLFPSSFPPSEIIERASKIWKRRGIKPKQHLSEPRPGAVSLMERRAHADRCENLPPDLPDDMDLMIEAKDKEQAVLYLHRMYELQPVIHANLRPANPNQTKETGGRKSTKRARAKAAKLAAEMDEDDDEGGADPKLATELSDCEDNDVGVVVDEVPVTQSTGMNDEEGRGGEGDSPCALALNEASQSQAMPVSEAEKEEFTSHH